MKHLKKKSILQQRTFPGKPVKHNSICHKLHGGQKITQGYAILERVKMVFEEGDLLVPLLSGFSPTPCNFALYELLQSHF